MIFHPLTVTLRHEAHPPVDLASVIVYLCCAIGVGLLTRRRPALGVAALLVLAPFDLARYVGPTSITTLKAGLVGLLVVLAFSRPDLAAFRTLPVRVMLVAFFATLLAIALSAIHAQNLGAVVREAFKNGEYLVLFAGAIAAFAAARSSWPSRWSAARRWPSICSARTAGSSCAVKCSRASRARSKAPTSWPATSTSACRS